MKRFLSLRNTYILSLQFICTFPVHDSVVTGKYALNDPVVAFKTFLWMAIAEVLEWGIYKSKSQWLNP